MIINNSYFYNNQDGLLAAPDPNGTILIENSEFYHNGVYNVSSVGYGYTHNMYINDIKLFTIKHSYVHAASVGHEIKSRAQNTVIIDNRIQDENGTASYSVDLPNGGNALIENNTIEQGPFSGNPAIISFGEEGNLHSNSNLQVINNTILNDLNSPSAVAVVNDDPNVTASISGNKFYGLTSSQIATGSNTQTNNIFLTKEPRLNTSSVFRNYDKVKLVENSSSVPPPPPPPLDGGGVDALLTVTSVVWEYAL